MQAGLAYTYIHAGARKVDGNPHDPLSPDVKSRLQADVDVLYSEFVSLVAKRRKCSPESIRATEAAVFRGQDAVNIGLADAVGTLQQAHDRLAASLQKQTMRSPFFITATSEASMSTDIASSPEHAPADVPGTETLDAETLMAKAEANLSARLSALSDIAAQARRLGIEVDPVKALREGVLPDALRQQVLQQAAERDNAASTIAAHPLSSESQPVQSGKSSKLAQAVKSLCPQEKHHA